MRIGVVSDLHGGMPPGLLRLLAGADRILFAGDAERPELLADLGTIAPVDAVWGNVDGADVRTITREERRIELSGVRFAVTHGHLVAPRFELLMDRFPDADVVVHGHSHVPVLRRSGRRWLLNPGSARLPRGGWPPSIAIVDIGSGGVRIEHLALPGGEPFDPSAESHDA